MTENQKGAPVPGVYVKGDSVKTANTAAKAVALVFEGYQLQEQVPAEDTSYRELQAEAKELGIPANQSDSALRKAIAKATVPSVPTELGEQRPDTDS